MTGAPLWEVLSGSVTGANHVKVAQPNQDSLAAHPETGPGQTVVLAVADGHGSERYVRSDTGASIATRVLLALGLEYSNMAETEALTSLKALAEEALPRQLGRHWREQVVAHLESNPLGNDVEDEIPGTVEPDAIRTYGTTVLGAVITGRLLVCWQLGDGDILLISDAGEVTAPLAPDTPEVGVETDSLAEADAWQRVRVHWAPLSGDSTSLVVLSTDGLANSFASEQDFRAFGSDTLEHLRSEGIEQTRLALPTWLAKATSFSGDDVTVAAAWQPGPEHVVGPDGGQHDPVQREPSQ